VWHSDNSLGGTIGTDKDILVARSTDSGATWTASAALNTNAATDSGDDYGPAVTTDGAGNWVAVWSSGHALVRAFTDYDILAARSTDSGATWTPPAALNTNAGSDSGNDGRPQVRTDGAGNWVAVWMSRDSLGGTIGTDSDILVACSTDDGATWTPPAALNTNAGSDSGHDGFPQVTTDGAGSWVAVWHSFDSLGGTIGTDEDILVARSTDDGATWTPPAALNTNAGSDSGHDSFPQVTTDGAGSWVAVWYSSDSLGGTIGTDYDILMARSTDSGATWTPPVALNTNAATDSGGDRFPQVTTDGAGSWVAAWQSNDSLGGTIGTDRDILMARSANEGATWTPPVALNTNAATDSGGDVVPQVPTDGAGNWVAVWYSGDSLGGTIGEDSDILVSIGSSLSCGDGFFDPGEECDDGNTENCDGCSAICTLEDACACNGGDTDEDTLCDDEDPCKYYANTLPLVRGSAGIPKECLCGDFDGDSFHSAADAAAINDCAAFIRFDCVSERDEVAGPFDGFYSATDADLVNRVAAFLDPAYTLTCPRRPEGTCGGDTGVSCF
jgi:cysteine-rich repeat protein